MKNNKIKTTSNSNRKVGAKMPENNFLPLNRKLQKHWIWNDKEPFDKRSAWIDLLMLANYETKKTVYKGEVIECKRGNVNISILQLAERWRWSREKTRRFLHALQSDEMITINATTHRTTITLVNYEVFNYQKPTNEATNEATSVQQDIQQAHTTNKYNNLNKDNKKNNAPELLPIFEDFCQRLSEIYPPEKMDKTEAFDSWKNRIAEKKDMTPQEASNRLGYTLYEYAKTFKTSEDRKYILKLSNAIGKDFYIVLNSAEHKT